MTPIGPPALRRALFRAGCLLLTDTVGLPQTAPTAPPAARPEEAIKLEAVTVTGSNIRRIETETALPITIIDREDMDLRGASTPADLFETFTLAAPPLLSEQESAGQSARGDNTSIDLRGLGSGSTLVLVNGRRVPPHPISQSEFGTPALSVNINTVPAGLSSRVEILRDGASAIYGSEAAAGVVNYILTPRFDGLRTTLRGSATHDGGASEQRFTLTWGNDKLNNRRTRVSFGIDLFARDALMASDRWYSKHADLRRTLKLPPPWDGQPFTLPGATALTRDNDFNNASNISRFGFYVRGIANPDGSITGSRPASNRGINTATTTTTQSPAAAMSTDGRFYLVPLADGSVGFHPSATVPTAAIDSHLSGYYHNTNDAARILPKTNRLSLGASIDHRLTNGLTAFGDLMLYRANSVTGRTGVQIDAADTRNLSLGADNPFNPFGSRFYHATGAPNADGSPRFVGAPSPVVLNGVRPADHKNRDIFVQTTSYRALAGLRGKLGTGWEWESAVMWGGAYTHDFENRNIRESKLAAALQSSDPATAYNPFGYTFRIDPATQFITIDRPYSNREDLMTSMTDEYHREAWTGLGIWDFKANGKIWELFGNDVAAAAGVEARYETYKFRTPPYAGPAPASDTNPFIRRGDNDFILLSPNDNTDLSRKVYSVFAEVLVPFIAPRNDLRFARSLELTLAARLERFPGFGNATKPKASLGYTPFRWLKMRASVNESFKAPNILQTNPARRQVFASAISDPYRFEVTNIFTDGSTGRTVFREGNPGLKPEESINYTAGFVLEVPGIKGLAITADFWRANQNNLITSEGGGLQLLKDEEMLDDETRRQVAAGITLANVDLGSGTAAYKGNPLIKRAPVAPADRTAYATYNSNPNNTVKRGAVGPVVDINEEFINLAGRDIEGVELGLEYRLPRSERFGSFTVRGEASFRAKFKLQESPGAVLGNDNWEDGRAKWRWNTSLRWSKGRLSLGWFTNYFGSFVDTGVGTTAAVYEFLGRPDYIDNTTTTNAGTRRYLLKVRPSWTHNFNASYRFDRRHKFSLLRSTSVRLGVNNVLNADPQLVDATYGYQGSAYNPRGRQFWFELAKEW
ncbi:MAG: TonB-dependent receptor [Opitutaceae bacterium]|nr:TonB-dependent receptor [Opitutaceae bacterium]